MPDLEIDNLMDLNKLGSGNQKEKLKVDKDNVIWYDFAFKMDILCPFNFENYPLDRQYCIFTIGSFQTSKDILEVTGKFYAEKSKMNLDHLEYTVKFTNLTDSELINYYHYGHPDTELSFSRFGIKVTSLKFPEIKSV